MADVRYQNRSDVETREIDQGLRAYMHGVYGYMAGGLAMTGAAAYLTFNATVASLSPIELTPLGETLYLSPARWIVILAPLAMVFTLSFGINRLSVGASQALFWLYSALMGVSLSSLGLIYTGASLTQVFLITACMFGTLSLWGYTTKRDLTSWGAFLFMGLIGLIVASLVNLFFQNGMMQFVLAVAGVIIFTGFTAYDTQKIKEIYHAADSSDTMSRKAIIGALNLYLDFINLFLSLLRLLGSRR